MIGLIQVGNQAMADRYAYLPVIGLFIMIVWSAADCASSHLGQERLTKFSRHKVSGRSRRRRPLRSIRRHPRSDTLLARRFRALVSRFGRHLQELRSGK
jgi:hypothetical protein